MTQPKADARTHPVTTPQADDRRSKREWVIVLLFAVALTVVFWSDIWQGGGIIGGDLFTYFMPQKQFLAERLQAGEFPLWNNRTSFGYPIVAESQTGGLYPPHFVLYRLFDINTAYNINQLLHYVATFVFAWLLAREIGVKSVGALLAALIYTYGWFPARLCLEWAIVGGCYLPLVLWLLERFLKTCHWRFLIYGSVAIAFQLLAGHYNLAFITQLTLVVYLPARLWFASEHLHEKVAARKFRAVGLIAAALCVGFTLAAVQLLPTWELKRISQRADITIEGEFDPGYGRIPPAYLHQSVLLPWWYFQDLQDPKTGESHELMLAGSNYVEAHLYFGLASLILILAAAIVVVVEPLAEKHSIQFVSRFRKLSRRSVVWLLISVLAVAYATGLFLPITRHLPGFSFFRGPGRYGIVATLGIGIVAGSALTVLFEKNRFRWLVVIATFLLTIIDFWNVSRVVTYSTILPSSALDRLDMSPVREIVQRTPQARLLAPGPNLTNLLGVSSVPEYLGIGPAEYYESKYDPPVLKAFNQDLVDWAKRHGVTHVLTFETLPIETLEMKLVFAGPDPFLNPAWGRMTDPLFLWQVVESPGRVLFADGNPDNQAEVTTYDANVVEFEVALVEATDVVLTDLMYPGWEVEVDGHVAVAKRHDGLFRAVEVAAGKHTVRWTFRPMIFKVGAIISALSVCLLLAVGHVRFWRYGKRVK